MRTADESSMRIDAAPFRPDGGAPFLGTVGLFFGAALAGAVAGWGVESVIGTWGCCCVVGPIQIAVLSFVLGGVGGMAVHLGKIRSPFLAGAAGLVGVGASVMGKLYAEYERALVFPNWMLHDPLAIAKARAGTLTFIDYLGEVSPAHFGWIALGMLFGAGGCIALMARAASVPFCAGCQNWKARHPVATLTLSRDTAVRILDSGALVELATVVESRRPTHRALFAYLCPSCGTEAAVELELIDFGKAKKEKPSAFPLGVWTYPGWAWHVLDKLFPGRLPPPQAHPDRFKDEAG